MNVSAIFVVAPPGGWEDASRALVGFDGVEVHHVEGDRIIATIEAPTVRAEAGILGRIQGLPEVAFARLVQHHFEEDPMLVERGDRDPVPSSLKD